MAKFIGYTVGLECNGFDRVGVMAKVEYSRNADGSVSLQAVSGRSLGKLKSKLAFVTAEQYEDRSSDSIEEARWALAQVGYTLMADDCA